MATNQLYDPMSPYDDEEPIEPLPPLQFGTEQQQVTEPVQAATSTSTVAKQPATVTPPTTAPVPGAVPPPPPPPPPPLVAPPTTATGGSSLPTTGGTFQPFEAGGATFGDQWASQVQGFGIDPTSSPETQATGVQEYWKRTDPAYYERMWGSERDPFAYLVSQDPTFTPDPYGRSQDDMNLWQQKYGTPPLGAGNGPTTGGAGGLPAPGGVVPPPTGGTLPPPTGGTTPPTGGQAGGTLPPIGGAGGSLPPLGGQAEDPYGAFFSRGEQLLRDRMGMMRDDLFREQDERMASRGLIGSSVETAYETPRLQERVMQAYGEGLQGLDAQARTFGLAREGMQREDRRFDKTFGLQERALDLQAKGMSQDEAYRQATLDLQKETQRESLRLQAVGLSQQDSQYYAGLMQDREFKQLYQNYLNTGQSQQVALQLAEQQWRREYGQQELGMRGQELGNQSLMLLYQLLQNLPADLQKQLLTQYGGR